MATHNGEAGMAKIKEEFLLLDYKPTLDKEYISDTVKEQLDDDQANEKESNEPPAKKLKLKGRNKKRPKGKKLDASNKLCSAVVHERACSYGDKCKFNHDKALFMEKKPADIADSCYLYDTYGKCDYGITCRFAKCHLNENFNNLSKDDFTSKTGRFDRFSNVLKKDLQVSLWKRRYDFSRSNKVLDKICPAANKFCKDKDKSAELRRNKANAGNDALKDPKASENKQFDSNGTEAGQTNVDKDSKEVKSDNITEPGGVKTEPAKDANSNADLKSVTPEKSDSSSAVLEGSNDGKGEAKLVEDAKKETDTCSAISSMSVNPDIKDSIAIKEDMKDVKVNDADKTEGVQLNEESVIRLRPQEKKLIDFSNKLYLAPLTTVGNLPFRRICKEYGADITCGEMAVCTNLLQGQQSEWALLKRHESEDLFGVQLCGAYPDSMTRCAQLITETMDVDFIDINCGCPIDLIFNKGEGSALMGRLTKFEQIIKGMKAVIDVPLTAKIRTGIYNDKNTAHTLVPHLRDWGCALTTIHGRSRVQRYTKSADWDYISEVAEAAKPMPVFGNGDILSFEDANERREKTGVSGLMIARGALIKPWIFKEIKEQKHWDISSHERFEMLKKYTNFGLDHWGSDHQGVENTRRFLLEWLSFLYRYIPVGVLERVPQQINERPPYYKGRDDLETLMASSNCGDWIKISEMLLGPVPEDFNFLPKHKANAYK